MQIFTFDRPESKNSGQTLAISVPPAVYLIISPHVNCLMDDKHI